MNIICVEYATLFYMTKPDSRLVFDERLESFTAMKIEVVVFRVLAPCNDVVGYQCFGGPCCLHLQGEVNIEIMVSYCITTCYCIPEGHNMKGHSRRLH